MKCINCEGFCVKNGLTANGFQRYKCNHCKKQFQNEYSNTACIRAINSKITVLLKEGCGIRSISRILKISTNTVQNRILLISKQLQKPVISLGKSYEVDELCTFIGSKSNRYWVAYALRKNDKAVVDFRVGKRTNKTLRPIIETLTISRAKTIFTDKLKNYRHLIEQNIHKTFKRGTNHIERMNLNLRTHLKRLNRKSICFSKSLMMLRACLTIYFWG